MADQFTVTGDAADMIRGLGNAALFAGTDKTLPVLCNVHLRMIEGTLVAEATDRKTVAQHMIRSAEGAGVDGLLLNAKQTTAAVRSMAGLLHASRKDAVRPALAMTYDADAGTVALTMDDAILPRLVDVYTGGVEWPVATTDHLFRDHGARLRRLGSNPWDRRFVIDRRYLARLAAVRVAESHGWDHAQMQFTHPGEQVSVAIGGDFRALIMSVASA